MSTTSCWAFEPKSNCSANELLAWLNGIVGADFGEVSELRTGAAYCQAMHYLFPYTIDLRTVVFFTNVKMDCVHNYKLLQSAIDSLRFVIKSKIIPILDITEYRYIPNLHFLIWFKQFYDSHCKNSTSTRDHVAERFNQKIGYGTPTNESVQKYIAVANTKPQSIHKAEIIKKLLDIKVGSKSSEKDHKDAMLQSVLAERNSYKKKLNNIEAVCKQYLTKHPFAYKMVKILQDVKIQEKSFTAQGSSKPNELL
ncbi:microtubule-associated protein RP/EB family member 3-like [Teleopsis dalmanni]|uniref:microtubule-associated protein RP/EB family member 3-like n=1 Tax=Teleopsis dalmanni TaxID=139649 RepID=UPI0018CFBD0E|nr:microtubule-associated protein RP/EB family member 3-like [Teleopsis dalmanni]